ncbi:MAG TPA: hypothetical protein VM165_24410 [Planctomycetaceae bacterium]|nr:hypothetical protein [Planctomycetaceae bacterium]
MSAKNLALMAVVGLMWASVGNLIAQEEAAPAAEAASPDLKAQAGQTIDDARRKAETFAVEVDKSPKAKEITAGILQPIYKLAEQLAFPMFHWIAFAVMATGVVSYALQLVLAKLVVLSRMGFSPAEILSDALGLLISLIGLVLTTQAAAENSTFTQSPASVLSATVVGVVAGFIFYRWGQAQEVQATLARTRAANVVK